MKYRIPIYIIIIFSYMSCTIKKERELREEIIGDTLFVYDATNTLRMKALLVNGKKNGEVDSYDSLGRLQTRAVYKNDTISGYVDEYYPSGIVKSKSYYVNGKKFGDFLEFYDGFQDSTAVLRNGKWWIVPYSTKLKKFEFYDLRGKVMYYRKYGIDGNLLEKKGRIFQATFNKVIKAKKGETFSQGWITPDPSYHKELGLRQYYVIKNLTVETIKLDTVYSDPDSTFISWTSKILKPGKYRIQAIAYLLEKGKMETDTSNFIVKILE